MSYVRKFAPKPRVNRLQGQGRDVKEVFKTLTIRGDDRTIIFQGPVRKSFLLALQDTFRKQALYRSLYTGAINKVPNPVLRAGEEEQFALFFNMKDNALEGFLHHLAVKPTAPEKKFIQKCILPRLMNGIFGGTYRFEIDAEMSRGVLKGKLWLGFEDFRRHLFDIYWNKMVTSLTSKPNYIVNI